MQESGCNFKANFAYCLSTKCSDAPKVPHGKKMTATAAKNRGKLFLVPTPIGNLEDITLRAIKVLREVDAIAAEDTRHSRKLLSHLGIGTPLISYYREKEQEKSEEILERLLAGDSIALVTDAGTPCISDPGSILVHKAHENGITVVPLPGASALTTALSAAGIELSSFLFIGFPPAKKGQRQKLFNSLANMDHSLVFYESPHRIENTLQDLLETCGDRQAFWARELTKIHEELFSGSISELLTKTREGRSRGEFVIIVSPGAKEEIAGDTIDEMLAWYRDNSELSLKDVSKKLAADLGLSRSQVYQKALEIWKNN